MEEKSAVSRRVMFKTGVAALAGAVGTQVFSWGAGVAQKQAATRVIKFTPASSSDFEDLLVQHFPFLVKDPAFAQVRPFTFLIENASSVAVKAHAATWTIETKTGTTQLTIPQFFRPRWVKSGSPAFATRGNHTRVSGQVNLIEKSGVRLASPWFSWNPRYASKTAPSINYAKLTNRTTKGSFIAGLAHNAAKVSVQLESVIFEDHVIVGQDRFGLAWKYAIHRNAEHDAASSLRSLIVNSAPLEKIEARLSKQVLGFTDKNGQPLGGNDPRARLYYSIRQRQAEILLARLLNNNYSTFVRTVQYLRKQPKTVIQTLSA